MILEAAIFQVGDRKDAIASISQAIDSYESNGMIIRVEQFGNNAFYISNELGGKNFIKVLRQALDQTVNIRKPRSKKVIKFLKYPLRRFPPKQEIACRRSIAIPQIEG